MKTLPGSFYAPELVLLLLGGNPIQFVPESFLSNFPKLRVLDLSHGRFYSLPDLKDLVWLDLSFCCNLLFLPDGVGKLQVLKYLKLYCWRLEYLPSGVVDLTSLQVLQINDCYNLIWAESLGHVSPTVRASLEDICGLVALTKLRFYVEGMGKLPHNISALTKLKYLQLQFDVDKTLPAEMPFQLIQLQELDLWGCTSLENLPRSFTCCDAFPALIKLQIRGCQRFVQFPELHEGALPKLGILDFTGCDSLGTLPLSLEFLTGLRKLILSDTLEDSCRANCEKSSTWRRFNIQYGLDSFSIDPQRIWVR